MKLKSKIWIFTILLTLLINGCGGGGSDDSSPSDITTTPSSTREFTLTVDKFGEGIIVSDKAGIDCGKECSKAYAQETKILLTATPDSGSEFKSWVGCDSVTSNICTVAMDSNKTVFPAFASLSVSLKPNVKILDENTMQYLIKQEDTKYFFDPQAIAVIALNPGDVIISGSGEGIFFRVISISESSDGLIVLETTGASLEDAIAEGTIIWTEKLTHADLKSSKPLIKGVSLRKPQKLNSVKFIVDINSTIDGVNITGNVATAFEPIFEVDIGLLSGLKEFKSGLITTNSQSLKLKTGGKIKLLNKKIAIWEHNFYPVIHWIPIPTPPFLVPIVLTPKVTVYIGIVGSAEAILTTSVTMETKSTVGVDYKKGKGWDKIIDFNHKFLFDPPDITASAEIKGYVLPEFTLLVYGAVGPYANIEGYLKSKASASVANSYLKWGIYGGMSASAGLKTSEFLSELLKLDDIPSARITAFENEWLITEKTIGIISDNTSPSEPLNLTADVISTNKINLSWDESIDDVGVKGYKVYRNGSIQEPVTVASFLDKNLNPATSYCYRVTAYDDAGNESEKSQEKCMTTSQSSDKETPSIPSGLTADAVSSNQINLSWHSSSDNVKVVGYMVYIGDIPLSKTVTTSSFSRGLLPSTKYCYTVYAFDKAGNKSNNSNSACVVTPNINNNGDFGSTLGEFNGVSAYSNSSSSYSSKESNYIDNIYMGIKWQCFEYVRRYYYSIYGLNLSPMLRGKTNAAYWYDNASVMGLESYSNEQSLSIPQVGDVLVSKGDSDSDGHIAIVRSVSNNQVCTIQQNFSNDINDVNRCLTMTNINGRYKVEGFNSNYQIQGWLRKKTVDFNDIKQHPLVLSNLSIGSGTGTVTSNPAGVKCGIDCEETYNFGTTVTLTATPSSGSAFDGWSGGGCSGLGSCFVTMDMAKTVTASFTMRLMVSTSVLSDGNIGSEYKGLLNVTGGTLPYSWSLVQGTQLPQGLSLSSSGVISGTPITAGTASFQVQVSDNSQPQKTVQKQLSISITGVPPSQFTMNAINECSADTPQVRLTWIKANNVDYYQVYKDGNVLTGLSTTLPSYLDTEVTLGSSHSYFIRAVNSGGTRDSNAVSLSISCITPPGQFTLTVVTSCSGTSPVNILHWTGSAGVTLPYDIYRNGTLLTSQVYSDYTDPTVNANTSYIYVTKATNSVGNTDSNSVTIATASNCAMPANPSILSVSPQTVTVGGGDINTIVSGSNFDSSSKILWNFSGSTPSTQLTTNFVDSNTLTAAINQTTSGFTPFTWAGAYILKVTNLATNVSSNTIDLTVYNPIPIINSISGSCKANLNCTPANGFDVRINGTGFVNNSTTSYVTSTYLQVNGVDANISKIGQGPVYNQLQLMVNGSLIPSSGIYTLKVCNEGTVSGKSCSEGLLAVNP